MNQWEKYNLPVKIMNKDIIEGKIKWPVNI